MTTVPGLHELQAAVRGVLLGAESGAVAALVDDDGLSAEARLDIYRHHVLATLTEVLEAAFPVVCRLVDLRFFRYLASVFLREHPPDGPCLFEYGDEFPAFLGRFEPCRHLAYLPDVARLEWAIHRAVHAEEAAAVDPERLRELDAEQLAHLRARPDPSMSWLASPWPVDQIWRAHQPGREHEGPVSLHDGGVRLEIRREGEDVTLRPLDASTFALRRTLAEGHDLATAAAAALAVDPDVDLARAVRDLLDERIAVEFTPWS